MAGKGLKALVTGASRGIGRAIAAALVREGYEVIGTSRDVNAITDEQRLQGVRYFPLELTSERSIEGLIDVVGAVDVLVNNAGASQMGPVEETPIGAIRRLFELNLFGLVKLTQGFVTPMRKKSRGHIVNIGSFAGIAPAPFQAAYAASKAALIALSRSLRHEVSPFGIRVTLVAPFDIRTAIPLEILNCEYSPYAGDLLKVKDARDRLMASAPEPGVVAEKVVKILASPHPRFFHPVGVNARVMAFLVKHIPGGVLDAQVRKRYRLG